MKLFLWLRYAAKSLRSGLRGFWILLSCLTLGVAAIAIVGSLASAVQRGISEQGQPLLGGDVEFSLIHREVDAEEKTYIGKLGVVSRVATLRAMATTGERSALVEVKAVDNVYPLYGSLRLSPAVKLENNQIAVEPLVLARLGLRQGDTLRIGQTPFRIASVIEQEPDRISDGFALGPRVLMTHDALVSTNLIQPGSLITWRYRVKLDQAVDAAGARKIVTAARADFPKSGWRVRARDRAAAGADDFVERLSYFMTLVGLSALVVGGAGIANAVSAFVNRRLQGIAAMKCMGLANRDVFGLLLMEIVLVALVGITVALALGAMAPAVMGVLFGGIIPLPFTRGVEFGALAFAGVTGLLATVTAALLPLSRISNIPGAALFRSHLVDDGGMWSWRMLALVGVLVLVAAGLVLWNFESRRVTAGYLAGLAGGVALLALAAYGLLWGLRRMPVPRHVLLRHAWLGVLRPGATSLSVIMALGLGLSLFVALALTDATISRELRAGLPDKAPAFFFLDVQNAELDDFRTAIKQEIGVRGVDNAPMLRGRILQVKGVAADKVEATPESSWALRGDRGLSYADDVPRGSSLTAGKWWAKEYAGPPLVSFVDDVGRGLGLKLGDKVTVNVLGREVEAEVASFRKVDWRSLGINFVMIFSPNTLRAAPHAHLVTVEMEGGDEAALLNRFASAYPSVTAIRVKDAIEMVSGLLGQMLAAVRGANVLTLLTGVLVLCGALAAGLSRRTRETVILKTYGATRRQLLWSYVFEYGLLGLVSAVFGVVLGGVAAWGLSYFVLELPFVFLPELAFGTAALAMVLTVGAGLAVTMRALSAKPSHHLRND